ncbi:GH11000 [Drosophila grimshawi]|uniref:aralkylamine N-acetyltransferase n=2 Tax=Drosophila grimshawi TaxID=7222 RepID=B4JBR6_DROGR|nr:GH11000 [Drosophila grimshawi]
MKSSHIDEARLFLAEHFNKHEPLLQTPGIQLPKASPDPKRREYHESVIRQGCSLIVVDQSNDDRIVGVAYAGVLNASELEQNWLELSEKRRTQPMEHIEYFLCNIKRNARLFQQYGVTDALYLKMIAVDSSMRRQGLGRRLVTALIDVGRTKGFPLLVATCTGLYSTRLMASLGMECVHSEDYVAFKDEDGNVVLKPPAPHTKASVMALKL